MRIAEGPRRVAAGLAAMALLAGCAPHFVDMAPVQDRLLAGDVPGAVTQFESRKGKGNDLLYLLEKGHILHLAGRYEESNDAFDRAERRAEELYTVSLSREAVAFLTSDLARPYRGLPYELELVAYYRAINYMKLGQPDEALVEARKANEMLARYAGESGGDPAVRQDPFLQYVTGLLYESDGDANSAAVSMREAARLYARYEQEYGVAPPRWLAADYYAVAARLGLTPEVDSLVAADPSLPERSRSGGADNCVLFLESGFVPGLAPVDITLPVFTGESDRAAGAARYVSAYGPDIYAWRADRVTLDHVLRFAFPELVERPALITQCEIVLPGGDVVRADPALDLAAVARAEFKDRLPGILLRTVVRALAKEGVRQAAEKKSDFLGTVANVVGVATEQADTRGWIFLPGRIHLAKLKLPEGVSRVRVLFEDGQGRVVEEKLADVSVPPGGSAFESIRAFR